MHSSHFFGKKKTAIHGKYYFIMLIAICIFKL